MILHILFYEIVLGKIINFFVFPVAWTLRKWAKKNNILAPFWLFLTDNNQYGDKTFQPERKDTFWKAYSWALRNPLRNLYHLQGKCDGFKDYRGVIITRGKPKKSIFCTYQTVNSKGEKMGRNGDIIDFGASFLGYQKLRMKRIYVKDGKEIEKNGIRWSKSTIKKKGKKLIIKNIRYGHNGHGRIETQFNRKIFKGEINFVNFNEYNGKTKLKYYYNE